MAIPRSSPEDTIPFISKKLIPPILGKACGGPRWDSAGARRCCATKEAALYNIAGLMVRRTYVR